MGIQAKLQKIAQVEEQVEALNKQYDESYDQRKRITKEVDNCISKKQARQEAASHKKKGIIGLVITVILVILEIMCLTETLIVGYSDPDLIDFVIIAIPLIYAITHFVKAKNLMPSETEQELSQKLDALIEEYKPFEELDNQLDEAGDRLRELTTYHGRDWDLTTFHGSADDTAKLAEDLEDLLIALKYNQDDTDFLTNCWLVKNQLKSSVAMISNDTATHEKYSHVGPTIIETGSWPLLLINACDISLSGEVLMLYLGTKGEGFPFPEALERIKMRKPETEDEQALWDLANKVIPHMIVKVVFALKNAMG